MRSIRSAKGFTLLEILITIVLITVGIVAISGIFTQGLASSIDAEKTITGMNLAQKKIEEIRNLAYAGITEEAKAGVTGFPGFQRGVTVSAPETDLKLVTVTVYWTYKGGEITIPLSTYISNN